MGTYIAFLRAINLGAKRRFAKDAIVAATEMAGGTEVTTYLNTGNVRLSHRSRSAAVVHRELEEAYAAEAGFEVELASLVARADDLDVEHQPAGQHYVTLFAAPPSAEAVRCLDEADHGDDVCVVEGRAASALLSGGVQDSRLLRSREFAALGLGTARTIKVLRTVVERWC
jgi:uncharacterized protein (DUF1697 family)